MATKRKLKEVRKAGQKHGRDVAVGPPGAVHTGPVDKPPDAGTAATRLLIAIEDVADKEACILAVNKLYTAFVDCYGTEDAMGVFFSFKDLNAARAEAYRLERRSHSWLLSSRYRTVEPGDTRIIL